MGTKKLGTLYYETKLLIDLKLRQQRALMRTPFRQSLRPNRLVVSEYEVPNFLGFQEWETFSETTCIIKVSIVFIFTLKQSGT